MKSGYWIELHGQGGVLDRTFVENEEATRDAAMELLAGCAYLSDGDRIVVTAGESER
jgi:hypothetical protein